MSIKSKVKKAVKVVQAVATGYADYAEKYKAINTQASKEVSANPSGSRNIDVGRVATRINEISKQQGLSLRGSIRSKLGL